MRVDLQHIRDDFPILKQKINGKPLIYFDNGATTQKPQVVLDALVQFYTTNNANIHRGVHRLSHQATDAYENARTLIQKFINARNSHEIIFTRGTTDSVNLVAESYGQTHIQAGDEILITEMEHHSNLVPWQILCAKKGAKLRVIPVLENGELDLVAYEQLLNSRTRLLALAHVSNVLGTINPVKKMIELAHQNNTLVLLDGAQAVPHMSVDVQELDCDFYAFSSHKMYGPTGVGILYGKTQLLEAMSTYQTGGGMVNQVSFENTTFSKLPNKFEAGTPDIANVVALGAVVEYLQAIGMAKIQTYENELLNYAMAGFESFPDVRIIGNSAEKSALISFVMNDVHPHDIGTILDNDGIAVRAGHHCAMPLMNRFNLPGTVRVSFGIYNNFAEIDVLMSSMQNVKRIFA